MSPLADSARLVADRSHELSQLRKTGRMIACSACSKRRSVVDEVAVPLAEPELAEMEQRCAVASKPPWASFVEGRDHCRAGTPEPDSYAAAWGRRVAVR